MKKRWIRRYAGYFVLAGIILVSFLVGLLVGAVSFHSNAVGVPEETKLPTVANSTFPTQDSTIDSVSVMSSSAETTKSKVRYYDVPLSTELQDYISSVCSTYNVPYELIYGMIEVESNFQVNAVSETNDYGLMQINKCNHEWLADELNITDILDPEQNILAGVYMIASHLEETNGDITLALMQYNCGATGAKRLWEQGIYSTSYTDKVMAAYENYKK